MKHLIKFNEHIFSSGEIGSHLLNKVSLLTISDLELDMVYKYRRRIESGEGRGNTLSALVIFIKADSNKYHFKVTKILTPNLANLMNFKVGDIIISDSLEVSKYITIK